MDLAVKGFQWDPAKNLANLEKHGIDFEDAKQIFYGPIAVSQSHHPDEPRWIAIGELQARLIAVVFTYRDGDIRIISARRARKNEERAYRDTKMG